MLKLSTMTTAMDLLVQSMDYRDHLDPARPSEATSKKSCIKKMTQDDDEQVLQAETESTNEGCSNSELN